MPMKTFNFNLSDFAPRIAELIALEKINELGAGVPDQAYKVKLQTLDLSDAVAPLKINNVSYAAACHAALWLRHDFLDESHTISQGIDQPTGSYWHGLMHRREGDYWNSKYWFRRVGEHPVYRDLQVRIKQVASHREEVDLLFPKGERNWEPFNFIDLVEKSIGSGSETEILCKQVQRLEWLVLFDYTYRQAVGT